MTRVLCSLTSVQAPVDNAMLSLWMSPVQIPNSTRPTVWILFLLLQTSTLQQLSAGCLYPPECDYGKLSFGLGNPKPAFYSHDEQDRYLTLLTQHTQKKQPCNDIQSPDTFLSGYVLVLITVCKAHGIQFCSTQPFWNSDIQTKVSQLIWCSTVWGEFAHDTKYHNYTLCMTEEWPEIYSMWQKPAYHHTHESIEWSIQSTDIAEINPLKNFTLQFFVLQYCAVL